MAQVQIRALPDFNFLERASVPVLDFQRHGKQTLPHYPYDRGLPSLVSVFTPFECEIELTVQKLLMMYALGNLAVAFTSPLIRS